MSATQIKPGVATGDELQAIFELAKAKQFALPAVNVINTSTVNAVMETAKELNSPAIIQFSNGGAQFFAGKGLDNTNQRSCIAGGGLGRPAHPSTRRTVWRDDHPAYRPRGQETAAVDRRPARRRRAVLQDARQAAVQLAHARPVGRADRGKHRDLQALSRTDEQDGNDARNRTGRHRR
jgi:hypothetical protein